VEETIIELRGNGVVMTIYEIDKETLDFLQGRASRIGEDLSQLWFDPFFWHNPEMHQIKLRLKKLHEYRGLMNDDISFMEIRRTGKKRKKYLVKELIGEGQLFPVVDTASFHLQAFFAHDLIIVERDHVIGRVGVWEYHGIKPFHLGLLNCFRIKNRVNQHRDGSSTTLSMQFSPKLFRFGGEDSVKRFGSLTITHNQ
jgi:hypothetical protein